MTLQRLFPALVAVVLLAGCGEREDAAPAVTPLAAEAPDNFLRYLNTQASLAAGEYQVVAATTVPGLIAGFELRITRDDGSVETYTGGWQGSGGKNPAHAGNRSFALVMPRAGGVKLELRSTLVDSYLYLLRDGKVVAEDDNSGGGQHALIDLPLSKISSAAYAQAYYTAVDPLNERTTLAGYLRRNCFTGGHPDCVGQTLGVQHHVVFRDSKDLGYGRNMYARRNSNGSVAFYVDNYVIRLQPGSSSNYGPINVEAAVRENREYHVGTNAIEFSPDPNDPTQFITKFFTYNKAGQRLTSADLDGRGIKHMPAMCWVCHGGRLMPLEADGSFPAFSLRSAKLNQLEVDSFEYSALAGWSRADLESGLRAMNEFVHGTYVAMEGRPDEQAAKWYAGFAKEVAEGRYGGAAFPATTYQVDHVPAGWQQTASRPEGVEQLYKQVVEPHCVACHSLQGTVAGEAVTVPVDGQLVSLANAINFSSWEKFISYRETIIDYVFHRGVMPLSLRNFEDFWRDPQQKPALLASFLGDASLFDAQGRVLQPGRPVARPGADRVATAPVQLDGANSLFAQRWQWRITGQPPLATATLLDAGTSRPVLETDTAGDYSIELVVGNRYGNSAPATLVVTVDDALAPAETAVNFVDDIAPLLGAYTASNCTAGCHLAAGTYDGIPVYYFAADNPQLYRDVLARVNLERPEDSLLLVKPTGTRHGGGVQINLDTSDGRETYETILRWVRAGAPCGTDPLICP